ncbi:hypothetical protein V3C33_17070 [Micrococcaceae bacterium Sec5.7]
MRDVWIRTANRSLIRADKVTEISSSSRGSVHEETGYSVKVVAGDKAFTLIDNSDRVGTKAERLDHAGQMQDALLLAIDAASDAGPSTVISHEEDRERWMLTLASDLAGDFTPLRYTKN